MKTFYNGLTNANRAMIDAAAGGTLMRKTLEKAYELLEEMVLNVYQWQLERPAARKTSGVHNIDTLFVPSTKIEVLRRKVDSMNASVMHVQHITYDLCGGRHTNQNAR